MTSQLLVSGLEFTQLLETLRSMALSFVGRVGIGNGGFQSANDMALIFICVDTALETHGTLRRRFLEESVPVDIF